MNCLRIIPKRAIYMSSIKRSFGFNTIPYEEQWESRDNENEIRLGRPKKNNENNEIRLKPNENNEIRFNTPYKSYGEWKNENKGTTSKERRIKMKEYLDQFYYEPHKK